jgi:hypothetical protein
MKILVTYIITGFMLTCPVKIEAQDIPVQLQQQLEQLAEITEEETEDDAHWLQLERLLRSPLNINEVNEDDLRELNVLSEWQISSLLKYRQLLGDLLSVYELQAVPGWDVRLLHRLLPFITVNKTIPSKHDLAQRFSGGSHTLLLRVSQLLETQRGFMKIDGDPKYAGSKQRVFMRYRYVYKNQLQYGWSGDKDPGEQFFKGAGRYGFDFNSVHLFARKMGVIEALALGDFTVNFGQGLIQWQSLAFKKSGDAIAVKRQSPVLKPYSSAGEYNFHRGAGITLRKGCIELSLFASFRKLSANIDEDSAGVFVTSVLTSGYHRTIAELAGRNLLKQFDAGAAIRYRTRAWHIGFNMIRYTFSLPLRKRDEPYNLFSIRGNRWNNMSVDYAYTYRNIHFFGELAADHHFNKAFLQGCMLSVDPATDVAIVFRHMSKEYQALNANAFTENTSPSNEKGFYLGLTWRFMTNWKMNFFADFYEFPWLKYLVDAPSYGKDLLLQVTHTPLKSVELQLRIIHSLRLYEAVRTTAIDQLLNVPRINVQFYLQHTLSRDLSFRCRFQFLQLGTDHKENGVTLSMDVMIKPAMKRYSLTSRLQFFETESYASRLYGFENDVLYSQSVPAVFGQGLRYYTIIQYRPISNISLGARWAQTVYRDRREIGSGQDLIVGRFKTELKFQIIYDFGKM